MANGARQPVTPSLIQSHNASSNGTCSHVRHHPAIVCDRLILKQVNRQSVLGFDGPAISAAPVQEFRASVRG
jgi:hypothetical protein